jgi:hypothetical protein
MHIYQQTHAVLRRAADEVDASLAWLGATGTPRSRMVVSAATVLVLHGLVLWLLIIANPKALPYREMDAQPAIDTELYEFVPPQEQIEPVPVIRPREVEPRPEPDVPEQPKSQPDPVPVPQPAPQVAQETYRPLPQSVNQTRDDFDPVKTPEAKRLTDKAVRSETLTAPQLQAERDARELAKLNAKKREEEGRIEAQRREALAAPGANDLDLHETPMPAMPNIAPSGLASDAPGKSSGGGVPPAGGTLAGGGLKGGRSGVSQALINHESCVALQQAGKPIPAGCNMKDLANMKSVGVGDPAGRAHYGPIVAKKEAYETYKRTPGNADYWKRVNKVPTVQDQVDKAPATPGTYSNQKERRAKGECHLNNSC